MFGKFTQRPPHGINSYRLDPSGDFQFLSYESFCSFDNLWGIVRTPEFFKTSVYRFRQS